MHARPLPPRVGPLPSVHAAGLLACACLLAIALSARCSMALGPPHVPAAVAGPGTREVSVPAASPREPAGPWRTRRLRRQGAGCVDGKTPTTEVVCASIKAYCNNPKYAAYNFQKKCPKTCDACGAATEHQCATEGGQCSCPGGKVKFGAGTTWTAYKAVSTSIACTTAVFGDPIYGVAKVGMCRAVGCCPSTCNCLKGMPANGGKAVNAAGRCEFTCSKAYSGVHYCGQGAAYGGTGSTDCHGCASGAATLAPTTPWGLDPSGTVTYTTLAGISKHTVYDVTVAQCKARCAHGKMWPGCKGFEYDNSKRSCVWASESNKLKPSSYSTPWLLKHHSSGMYTLPTGRPVDAHGCVLGMTAAGASAVSNGGYADPGHARYNRLDPTKSYLGYLFWRHAGKAYRRTKLTDPKSGWTGGGDMGALCGTLMGKLARKETICGAPFTLPCHDQCRKQPGCKAGQCKAAGGSAYTGTVHCNAAASSVLKRRRRSDLMTYYPKKAYTASDIVAVMDLCVTPCMHDRNRRHQCCDVPESIAMLFACCRERMCCPDQMAAGRRRRMQPRSAQGSSVSVSIAVEDNVAAKSVYDLLLDCLKSKSSAVCMRNTTITVASGH